MKKHLYIYMILVLVLSSCVKFDDLIESDDEQPVVQLTKDGQLAVEASFAVESMSVSNVSTRSEFNNDEHVYDGWCLIFGVDEELFDVSRDSDGSMIVKDKDGKETDNGYGPNSKLLHKIYVVANTDGRFYMTFTPTTDRVFMRFVVNMTDRENTTIEKVVSQDDADEYDDDQITDNDVSVFGEFLEQSVGLNGLFNMSYTTTTSYVKYEDGSDTLIYNNKNTTSPDAEDLQAYMPMSSYGYVLNGITEQSLVDLFNSDISMIRIFSKVEVFTSGTDGNGDAFDSEFEIAEVTLIDGSNEGRLRSTVLSSVGGEVENFDIPCSLGGSVRYQAVGLASPTSSLPIYLYPNEGGNYGDESIDPTYIVIKGRAKGYTDYGYYKVALKTQYPLKGGESDPDKRDDRTEWSPLTYDIWRNTHFSVNLLEVKKPGYATFEDAADENNKANNISYSITIDGKDNRNEFLISKGTYYVELETSRVYAKGYLGDAFNGSLDFSMTPSEGEFLPNVYIYSNDADIAISSLEVNGVAISTTATINEIETKMIEASDIAQDVTINFTASGSGHICIRCGDIQKLIPVVYQSDAVSMFGETLSIDDGDGNSWSDFSYDYIEYESGDITMSELGEISYQNDDNYDVRKFVARIFPKDNSGFTKLYVQQAGKIDLVDYNGNIIADNSVIELVYQSTGVLYSVDVNDVVTNVLSSNKSTTTYTIKGVTKGNSYATDCFLEPANAITKFTTTGWGEADASEFSFIAGNIGTNQMGTATSEYLSNSSWVYYAYYVSANYKTSTSIPATATIRNGAGESKSYTFYFTQYAKPYNSHGTDPCEGGTADRYITAGNHGETTHTCACFNCSKNTDLFSYYWAGGASGNVYDSFDVYHNTDYKADYAYVYTSKVFGTKAGTNSKKTYNTYVMTLYNDAGESIVKEVDYIDYSVNMFKDYGSENNIPF